MAPPYQDHIVMQEAVRAAVTAYVEKDTYRDIGDVYCHLMDLLLDEEQYGKTYEFARNQAAIDAGCDTFFKVKYDNNI